jgi:hypothetical protein
MLLPDFVAVAAGLDEADLQSAGRLAEADKHVVARFSRYPG